MVDYTLNKDAVRHCRELIDAGKYELGGSWSKENPSAKQGDDYIDKHGWHDYGLWHLGLVDGANDETKKRYGFPYGDFEKVDRAGLAAAAERAGQNDHAEIERAAHELLEHLHDVAGDRED
ncbi:hypothetical protein [Mobilicoccus massiliensis]|uniref:hypothetical protein n=1 Tax=Mobilicoccus massiliensis TaxID=1522310 RepID=UPI0005906768|nr:hypothetical protein [Mobilicoccus massiliensis]